MSGTAVTLNLSDRAGAFIQANTGTLTAGGVNTMHAAAAPLLNVNIVPVFGCPDCADGGASYVDLERNGVVTNHAYPFNGPQPALVAVDDVTSSVMTALRACIASPYVTPDPACVPNVP